MTAPAITRHFVRVGEREVHYRRAGQGPPFVLLHSSPQSAAFVMPGLLPLAERWTLIGLDTPGYGGSDPLPMEAPTAADYADATAEGLAALGIARAPVYGTHTGAHIAMELGLRHAERVAGLVLDGISFNTPEEAQERFDNYAPAFTPTADGAHLAWAWQHTRDQIVFYPWFRAEKGRRLNANMASADYIHDIVLAKMDAAGYWLGYRAAFSHDSYGAIRNLTVNTSVVARDGDVLAKEAGRLNDLPANVRVVEASGEGWLGAIDDCLSWCAPGDTSAAPAPTPDARRAPYRSYVQVGDGQRLVRRGGRRGRPLVLLHGDMSSSRTLLPLGEAVGRERPFVALDVAGNAESDPLADSGASLAQYAGDVRAILKSLGIEDYDVYGGFVGAALALEIAHQDAACRNVILNRPVFPAADERDDYLDHYAPTIETRWDGTHFLTAWHMLRDRAFFWPWYRRTRDAIRWIEPEIDPRKLQSRMLDWLKGRLTYGDYVRAGLGADLGRYGRLAQRTLITRVAGDRLDADAERVNGALPASTVTEMPADAPALAKVFGDFLDG